MCACQLFFSACPIILVVNSMSANLWVCHSRVAMYGLFREFLIEMDGPIFKSPVRWLVEGAKCWNNVAFQLSIAHALAHIRTRCRAQGSIDFVTSAREIALDVENIPCIAWNSWLHWFREWAVRLQVQSHGGRLCHSWSGRSLMALGGYWSLLRGIY